MCNLWSDESGLTAAEWALLIALVVVVALTFYDTMVSRSDR